MNKIFLKVMCVPFFLFFWLESNAQKNVCPNGNISIESFISGAFYKWEVGIGNEFSAITDNINYVGSNTAVLQINAIPALWNGYQYRCIVDNQNSIITTITVVNTWSGTVDSVWENPLNWSCGVLPDSNGFVSIPEFSPIPVYIQSNITCRGINVGFGSKLFVNKPGSIVVKEGNLEASNYNLSIRDVEFLDSVGVKNPSADKIIGPDGTLFKGITTQMQQTPSLLIQIIKSLLLKAQSLAALKESKVYDTNEGGEGPKQYGLAYSFGSNEPNKRLFPLAGDNLHKSNSVFGIDCSGFIQELFESSGITFKERLTTRFDIFKNRGFKEKLQAAIDSNPQYAKVAVIDYGNKLLERELKSGDIILWEEKGHVGIISDIVSPPSTAKIIWQSNGQPNPLTKQGRKSWNPDVYRTDIEEQAWNLSLERGVKPIDFLKAIRNWDGNYKILRLELMVDARDNRPYKIRQIGSQIWLAENLAYNYPGSYCYQNSTTLCDIYGRLYDWAQAKASVPTGWHLPTDSEWEILSTFLGNVVKAGGIMKEVGTGLWNSPNTGATNKSGFSGLPGGNRNTFGTNFGNLGIRGFWWSSTINPANTGQAFNRVLDNESTSVGRGSANRTDGRTHFSVRLIKDQ